MPKSGTLLCFGYKKGPSFERSCKKETRNAHFPSSIFIKLLNALSYYFTTIQMYSCFLFFSNSIILHKQRVVQVVLGRFTSRLFFRRAGFRHVSVQLFPGVPDFGTFPCSYFPACRISARFRAAISRRAGFRHVSVQLFPGVPDFGTLMCSEPNSTLFLHNSCCHSCQR